MTVDEDVSRVWRRFASQLAVALLVIAVTFGATAFSFRAVQSAQSDEISNLREQLDVNTSQTECRSRIAAAAEAIRADRDSLGWQSLVDRLVSGQTAGLEDRSLQMADLNRRLLDATALRSRAIEVCAADSNFVPPS